MEIVVACETPHLIGVVQRNYEDRHGSRPSYGVAGYILDRSSGHRLGASDLLKPGTDMAPLDTALQAAIDKAKHVRHGDQPVRLPPASSLPTWDSGRPAIRPRNTPPTDATLAPSATAGVAGGLQFLYGPYDAGAYSDGSYRVVLPYSVFAAALRPQFSSDFADAPALSSTIRSRVSPPTRLDSGEGGEPPRRPRLDPLQRVQAHRSLLAGEGQTAATALLLRHGADSVFAGIEVMSWPPSSTSSLCT